MSRELFSRFIGSAPGYQKRKEEPKQVITKSRAVGVSEDMEGCTRLLIEELERARNARNVLKGFTKDLPPQTEEPIMVPEIRNGKIVRWTTF